MAKKQQSMKVYLVLRPKLTELLKVWNSLTTLIERDYDIDYSLAGLSSDAMLGHLTLGFDVPLNNSDAQSINTLRCIHDIMATFYQCLPCYSPEPSEVEILTAQNFLNLHAKGLQVA